jgi:Flp pilus assembly CpaE family ATPase
MAAKLSDKPVLLADLDFEAGLLRFILKAKPRYTLRDALENMHRMDSSYWNALVSKHGGHLEFIAAPEELTERTPPDPQQLGRLLRFMRTMYPVTVVDFGRFYSAAALESVPELEAMYLMVTEDPLALENARDFIRMADERGKSPDRIQVLVNKAASKHKPDLGTLETFLGVRPAGVYGEDSEALYETWSEGRLLGTDCQLGRQLSELAKSMWPAAEAPRGAKNTPGETRSEVPAGEPPAAAAGSGFGRILSFMRSGMRSSRA